MRSCYRRPAFQRTQRSGNSLILLKKLLGDKREYLPLFAIFLIALALRITTARFDYLLEADPWYHYHFAKTVLASEAYPMWDYSIYYPTSTGASSLIGLYYLPVYFYKLAAPAGISFFKSFQILPTNKTRFRSVSLLTAILLYSLTSIPAGITCILALSIPNSTPSLNS